MINSKLQTYYEFCDDLGTNEICYIFPEGIIKYGDDIGDWCKESDQRGFSEHSRIVFIMDPNDRILFRLKFPQCI